MKIYSRFHSFHLFLLHTCALPMKKKEKTVDYILIWHFLILFTFKFEPNKEGVFLSCLAPNHGISLLQRFADLATWHLRSADVRLSRRLSKATPAYGILGILDYLALFIFIFNLWISFSITTAVSISAVGSQTIVGTQCSAKA